MLEKTVTVTLPADLVDCVDAAIEAGDYASLDEAVRVALESLEADRAIETLGLNRVRELWREGVESGPSVDAGAVFTRLSAKYRRMAQERGG